MRPSSIDWRGSLACEGRRADLRVREVPIEEADRRARAGGFSGMLPDELDCLLCDEVSDSCPARGPSRPAAHPARRGPGGGRARGVRIPRLPRRHAPLEADVAVLGSGLPALAAALELSRRGARVAVLGTAPAGERPLGLGLALLGPGRPYARVARALGRSEARLVWAAGCENHLRLRALVDEARRDARCNCQLLAPSGPIHHPWGWTSGTHLSPFVATEERRPTG